MTPFKASDPTHSIIPGLQGQHPETGGILVWDIGDLDEFVPVGDLLLELNNRAHLLPRRISRPTLSSKRTVAPSTSARAVAASASAPVKPPGPRAGHQEAGDRALPRSGMGMIVGLQWEKPVTRQPGNWGILVSMQIEGSVPFGTEPLMRQTSPCVH